MIHKERYMKSLVLALALTASSGCATLERHPVLTAVGSAIIVGSVAATIEANRGDRRLTPVEDHFCGCRTQ
jgi:hypothetical protein